MRKSTFRLVTGVEVLGTFLALNVFISRFPCISAPFDRFFDSSMVSILNATRRDPWATISFYLLLYFNFGVREDAVATAKEGLLKEK